MDILSFPALLFSLSLYFVFELLWRTAYKRLLPAFYVKEVELRKDHAYFAFLLGFLITALSTPVCMLAAASPTSEVPLRSDTAGQVCIISRATLWISELNRLSHASGYVYHHLFSLAELSTHMSLSAPIIPRYAIYASLVTEVFSSAGCMLSHHGYRAVNSRLARNIQKCNSWGLLLIRGAAWAYAVRYLQRDGIETYWSGMFTMLVYGIFVARMVYKEFKRLEIVSFTREQNGVMVINVEGIKIPLYGIFVTIAYFTTVAITMELFSSRVSSSPTDIKLARKLLGRTFLAAGIGARIPEIVSRQGIAGLLSPRNYLSTRGFWFQAGLLTSILTILYTPFSSLDLNTRRQLLACGAVGLLLGESVGRIGCYFGGCCGAKKRVPVPIISSALNILAFSFMLQRLGAGMRIPAAGAIALAMNGLIRAFCDTMRSDVQKSHSIASTSMFALCQLILGVYVYWYGKHEAANNLLETQLDFDLSSVWTALIFRLPFVSACSSGEDGLEYKAFDLPLLSACSSGEDATEPKVMSLPLLSACSSGEDVLEANTAALPLLSACSSGEDSLTALVPLTEACSSGEDSVTIAVPFAQACSSGEDTLAVAASLASACSSGEDAVDSRTVGLQACSSGEDSREMVSAITTGSMVLSHCGSGEDKTERARSLHAMGVMKSF